MMSHKYVAYFESISTAASPERLDSLGCLATSGDLMSLSSGERPFFFACLSFRTITIDTTSSINRRKLGHLCPIDFVASL